MPKSNDSFSTKFIVLSLIILLLFIVFAFIILPSVVGRSEPQKQNEKFYLNEKYPKNDPLLTNVPGLKDMITGPIITGSDPYLGPDNALIDIVAYTDFECSYCYKTVQEVKKIQAEMPEKIRLIHKDFPINDDASASFRAALAGRCAQEQNKFWEMAELLYQNNYRLNNEVFNELAKETGLNLKQFNGCLSGENARNLVLDNIEEANALKIIGVPLFYINDQEVLGDVGYEEVKEMVERELHKS